MHLQYWLSFYDKPREISEELFVSGVAALGVAAAAAVATAFPQQQSGVPVLPSPRHS